MGEMSERQGEAHIDFSEHTDTILNRTELVGKKMRKKIPMQGVHLMDGPKNGLMKIAVYATLI